MNGVGVSDPRVAIDARGDGTSVLLAGEWDLSVAPQLRETLDGVDASKHVVFDLTGVSYVDSSTLRVLIEFKQRSKHLGGTTALFYGGNDRARKLMTLSGVGIVLRE